MRQIASWIEARAARSGTPTSRGVPRRPRARRVAPHREPRALPARARARAGRRGEPRAWFRLARRPRTRPRRRSALRDVAAAARRARRRERSSAEREADKQRRAQPVRLNRAARTSLLRLFYKKSASASASFDSDRVTCRGRKRLRRARGVRSADARGAAKRQTRAFAAVAARRRPARTRSRKLVGRAPDDAVLEQVFPPPPPRACGDAALAAGRPRRN